MDPMMILGGGALLGGALGLAGGIIQGDAAQNAAGAQLGYLDLALQQSRQTQLQQMAMLQPYMMYGTNALTALQQRVMSGTERQIAAAQTEQQLKAKIASLAQETDWNSMPILTGPNASERRATMWQQLEFDRKQQLQQAQSQLDSFYAEQKALAPLQAQLEQQLNDKQARVDNAVNRITNIAPVNIPTSLAQLRSDMNNDPVFQFRQEQGERAINRAAAARGQFFSGVAMEQLSDFNLALSGEETDKYFNRVLQSETARFNSSLQGAQSALNAELGVQQMGVNNLFSLANMGANATNTGVNALANNAQLQAGLLSQQGQTAAAGIQGKAAGLAQGLNSFAGALGAGTSMYALSGMMNQQPSATSTGNAVRMADFQGGGGVSVIR